MHLMLRIASSGTSRTHDVVATVEPDHTVAELIGALRGLPEVVGDVLARPATGQVLDPESTLASVGLVSGEELLVGGSDLSRQGPAAAPMVRFEAIGGPASGWRVELGPGTYYLGRPASQTAHDPTYRAIPDAAVSRSHLRVHVAPDRTVTVEENPDATNRLLVDGVAPTGATVIGPGQELLLGDSVLVCRPVEATPPPRVDRLGQVAFHRTPLRPSRPEEVTLPAIAKVPTEPEPTRFSWLATLAPLAGGILMAVALQEPRFLLFVLVAPLTGAASWFENRRRNRDRHDREIKAFEKRFAARVDSLAEAHAAEEIARLDAAPDLADLRRRAERHDRTLWSRPRDIPEFLSLRVGLGPAEATIEAEFNQDGDEEFVERLEELRDRYVGFDRVPVTVPVADLGVVGVQGSRDEVASLSAALVLQAICLHTPEDLVVAAAVSPELGLVDWLRWVPHTHSTGSPLGGRHLATEQAGADELLRAVLEVAEFRDANTDRNTDRRWPWILLVLDRLVEPDPHLVAQVLDRSPETGISVLWLSDTADRVPPQCRAVAELVDRSARTDDGEHRSRLWFTDPETPIQSFSADGVEPTLPDAIARSLAPLRDASSATATASIPRVVPLFSAHGVDEMTPTWIRSRWETDRKGEAGYALQTVVGTAADGPLAIDLVADGPHGLIGGTSGAGKSELIQSLVAGLVAFQSPRDLSLMFIDFKGGSASEVFKDLPHLSGRVTDLDESLALRARVSLRAELRRRVSLFSDHGAKDMAEMRRHHRDEAPPSLVIVIDEFATLVKQLPEFVADLIDIAQRGRSYGIHLLLATQRPSSSVDDNILANTNLRISLRMLDRAESMSILNAPDAADIPVPLKGRSIARMGPGQLVEFQSAYCSAPQASAAGRAPIHLAPLGLGAPGAGGAPAGGDDEDAPTQLDALIDAVVALEHPPVRQIWTDLLPEHLTYEAADAARRTPGYERDPGRIVLLGMADDPEHQRQHAAVVDLAAGGGLLVLGTGGSGKTTVLRTLAASAALDDQRAGGGTVSLFALDFSSGELRALEALPQCEAVGTLDDLESTTRIVETLHREVGRRRQRIESGDGGDDPTIVLLVDGYPNLIEALGDTRNGQEQATDQWLNAFHRIVLDGRQLGVHTVMTADRAASIRNSIFAAVTTRLVLRQIDPAETVPLGIPPTAGFAAGAGYLGGLRVQVATLAEPEVAADAALEAFAGIIDVTPAGLLEPALSEELARPDVEPRRFGGLVGRADVTGEVVGFDCTTLDMLVTGPPQSGKSWALRAMATQLEEAGHTVYAVGAEDSGLRRFDWKAAAWGADEVAGLFGTLKAELAYPGRDAVVVLDDLDLLENPAFDGAVAGMGSDRSIRFLGSTTTFGYSGNEVVKRVRSARQVLFLQPGSSREVAEVIGVMRLPLLRLGLTMPPGRGMFVRNRVPTVVQVFTPADTD